MLPRLRPLFGLLVLALLNGCETAPKPQPRPVPAPILLDTPIVGASTIDRMFDELEQFRRSASFRRDGFREGSRHANWLQRVGEARKDATREELREALTMLEVLGLSYANARGRETERTRTARTELMQARGAL